MNSAYKWNTLYKLHIHRYIVQLKTYLSKLYIVIPIEDWASYLSPALTILVPVTCYK